MKKRLENMAGAFTLFRPARLYGEKILLVDDVFTTGSTLSAATTTILAAKAAEVYVLTVARD